MDTKKITTGWLLSLVMLTAIAFGQSGIYVEFWNGSAWEHVEGFPDRLETPAEPGLPSGSDIDIINANNVTYRVFAVSPSTTDIGRITINAPNNSVQPRLLVGRFVFLTEPIASQRLDAAGARDVESIYSGTGKVRVQAWVTRDILSGGVDTHEVVRIDVDRDVLGPIRFCLTAPASGCSVGSWQELPWPGSSRPTSHIW